MFFTYAHHVPRHPPPGPQLIYNRDSSRYFPDIFIFLFIYFQICFCHNGPFIKILAVHFVQMPLGHLSRPPRQSTVIPNTTRQVLSAHARVNTPGLRKTVSGGLGGCTKCYLQVCALSPKLHGALQLLPPPGCFQVSSMLAVFPNPICTTWDSSSHIMEHVHT